MAEKRFDVTTTVRGTEEVERLRESFEELDDTIRDVGDRPVEVDGIDQMSTAMRELQERAEAAGAAVVGEAERIRTEMVQTKAATDALANALGPELAGKADMDAVVADLQRLGLSLEDIRAEADTLAAAIKQVDGVRLDGLNQGVDITNRGLDTMSTRGTQTRSVMANLAGNAAQDLGALTGVVGSLGVGIGQLAEYAVDGNIKLQDLAKLAGPIAALSGFLLAVTSANSAMKDFNDAQAAVANEQDNFASSLRDSGSQIEVVNELLRENTELTAPAEVPLWADLLNDLPLIGRLITDVNERSTGLVETMAAAGITQEEWNAALNSGLADWGTFHDRLERLNDSGAITDDQFELLTEQFNLYSDAALNAGVQTDAFARVMATSMGGVNQSLEDFRTEASNTAELWAVVMADFRDNGLLDTQQAVDAWNRLKVVLGNISDEEMTELANSRLPDAMKEQASATELASDAWLRYHEAIAAAGAELATVADNMDVASQRASAINTAFDELNSRSQFTATTETVSFVDALGTLHSTLHDLNEAIGDADFKNIDLVPDTWAEVMSMPDELGPVLDAIGRFRTEVQSEFGQAFTAGGDVEARQWAASTREAIVAELAKAGIESEEQINDILSALGLLPDQVETTIRISEEQQARQILADIQSALDLLPAEVQTAIALQAPTDPVGALQATIVALQNAGIAVPVELEILAEGLEADITTKVNSAKSTIMARQVNKVTFTTEADDTGAKADLQAVIDADRDPAVITAEADTEAADRELDLVALELRRATLTADADTSAADAELDATANGPRTAPITASAFTAAADAELNYLARDRTSVIRVVTVGSGGAAGGGFGAPFGAYRRPGELGPLGDDAGTMVVGPLGESTTTVVQAPAAAAPVVVLEESTPINVTVQAAVIGNGFDVERAVFAAVQDAVRFRGQRQVLTVAGRNP